MYDFIVVQPTYNRSDLVIETLELLRWEAAHSGLKVAHLILDDASDSLHRSAFSGYAGDFPAQESSEYQSWILSMPYNFGRTEHWRLVNCGFGVLQNLSFQYVTWFADDMLPCRGFFHRSRRHFEFLRSQDSTITAMTLLSSVSRLWGTTRYIDGHFIANRLFFDVLGWALEPIHFPDPKTSASSGTNKQMTDRLGKSEYSIAHAPGISYLHPHDVDSVVFPSDRFPARPRQVNWVTDNFIDSLGVMDANCNSDKLPQGPA